MPSYTYSCSDCKKAFDLLQTFTQHEEAKSGLSSVLCECGGCCSPIFNPGSLGASFKEGETGGWASKGAKERRNRELRWAHLGRKQKDHVKPTDLIPNYDGQVHDRWSDIQDHVQSTQGAAAAATYNPFVAKEKKLGSHGQSNSHYPTGSGSR
jgi:hypothetical protein